MRLEGKSLKSDFLRFIIPSIIAQWVFSLYTMVDAVSYTHLTLPTILLV